MSLRVRILGEEADILRSASPEAPTRLIDLLDEHEAWVSWLSCRSARCGRCRLTVVADPEGALLAAEEEERAGLAALAAGPGERLGCQLRVRTAAAGELVLGVPGADR